MLVIFLVVGFIFFAAIAPIETTIAFSVSIIVTTLVVKVSTRFITGNEVSFIDALKAIGLSTLFVILAFFGMAGFSGGPGIGLGGLSALVVIGLFFVCYIAGFSVALKTSFGQSTIIALVSSVVSGLLLAVIGL
ncbi:hypothetical protein ACS8E9_07065 [Pseudomonas neustonica]|uniref:hypothetical protein n=1 Tax=Pseudomonas neustonica TaxID=2487346 RepID=UPI003F47826B